MIRLSEPLDTIDFDALFEIARSKLPMLAPAWTDYNYSDPGIMLVDLIAWIADSQVYSLARDRRDERFAMAALLGLSAQGAVPAAGAVFPAVVPKSRAIVARGRRLLPIGAGAPRIEVEHEVALSGLALASIRSEGPHGTTDHTAANAEARATFAPFGQPPSAGTVLRIDLAGALGDAPVAVSIGFELDDDDDRPSPELGQVRSEYALPDGAWHRVEPLFDSTLGMRRSGVMILPLPAVGGRNGRSEHRLRLRQHRAALLPRIRRIQPDALPVRQRATLRPDPFTASGRPGQSIVIVPQALFGPDEVDGYHWRLAAGTEALDLSVRVQEGAELTTWQQGQFDLSGPGDAIYAVEQRADLITLHFGNGINGRRPAAGAQVLAVPTVSAGRGGNIAAGLEWVLDGVATRWTNREAIVGGRDADDLDDLLGRLRTRLGRERTLATSAQIEAAARDLPKAFGVERAAVVEGWEPGRRHPATPATRTLLVTRKGSGADGGGAPESLSWRRAIARRLRPAIALGERLIVASPRLRRLRVRVHAVAAPQLAPAKIAEHIREVLVLRLADGGLPGSEWPIGQTVSAIAVGGWIRAIPGVQAVTDVTLLDERGAPLAGNELSLGQGELPALDGQSGDVVVEPGTRQ